MADIRPPERAGEDAVDSRGAAPSRRSFLLWFGAGLGALAGLLLAAPVVGYLLSTLLRRRSYLHWIDLGAVSSFAEGQTRLASYRNPVRTPWDGQTSRIPCWVRRKRGAEFQVFAINCTHLGCPVRWFPESGLFMCPCHGGVYYEDGRHAAGPPPRRLYEYEHRVRNGRLWVRGGQIPTLTEPA